MALKKDSNSLGSEQEKSQNEDSSLLEFKNLENKKEIESQPLEVSEGNEKENGFLDFGFNQSILNSLKNKRKYLFKKFNDNNEEIVTLIDPSNLENVVPAIAITIHKSQGSESEKVNILWSQNYRRNKYAIKEKKDNQNIFCRDNFERRLFYTAVTRAKKSLNIYYLN